MLTKCTVLSTGERFIQWIALHVLWIKSLSLYLSQFLQTELIPVSVAWRDKEYYYSPLDGPLSIWSCFPNNLPVFIYIPGWREALWKESVLPKNTTLEPRPLDLKFNKLALRSLRLCNYTFTVPNISVHILHTILCTYTKVLTRRICLIIKGFFRLWYFLYSRDINVWFSGDIVRRN